MPVLSVASAAGSPTSGPKGLGGRPPGLWVARSTGTDREHVGVGPTVDGAAVANRGPAPTSGHPVGLLRRVGAAHDDDGGTGAPPCGDTAAVDGGEACGWANSWRTPSRDQRFSEVACGPLSSSSSVVPTAFVTIDGWTTPAGLAASAGFWTPQSFHSRTIFGAKVPTQVLVHGAPKGMAVLRRPWRLDASNTPGPPDPGNVGPIPSCSTVVTSRRGAIGPTCLRKSRWKSNFASILGDRPAPPPRGSQGISVGPPPAPVAPPAFVAGR